MYFSQFCLFTHSSNFFVVVFNFEDKLAFLFVFFYVMFINQLIVIAGSAGHPG